MSMFLIFNVVTVVEASAPLPPPGYISTYDYYNASHYDIVIFYKALIL